MVAVLDEQGGALKAPELEITPVKATEQVHASGKRIDLTRLAIRADEQGRQTAEMNLEIAYLLPDEKTP